MTANTNRYQARINCITFYAMIVRVDADGSENVIHGYKPRHFASFTAAERSTARYINKHHAA